MENGKEYLSEFKNFTWQERYFLLWQQVAVEFRSGHADSGDEAALRYSFYDEIFEEMLSGFEIKKPAEVKFGNSKLVYVFTTQFLGGAHAPTKKALRVAAYLKKAGYTPVIINTAECLGGRNPGLNNCSLPNYIDGYSELNSVTDGESIYSFVQYPKGMPDGGLIKDFTDMLKEDRPRFAVLIGDMSLMADAAGLYVPLLCINTVNKIGLSHARMQSIGRSVNTCELSLLSRMGRTEKDIIPGNYCYNLPENGHSLSREMFNVPEGVFTIGVAGNRLEAELSTEFLKMIDAVLSEDTRLLIIGEYPSYKSACDTYSNIGRYSFWMGYQRDILSAVSLCNLYVNPPRQGGGTVCVMALSAGVPVVTLGNCDAATAAGAYFAVEDLTEMKSEILKYRQDSLKLREATKKALERAKLLTDEDLAYGRMFEYFLKQ